MKKKKNVPKNISVRGRGQFVEIKITDQQNSHDILFKGRARTDKTEEMKSLFLAATHKGLDLEGLKKVL